MAVAGALGRLGPLVVKWDPASPSQPRPVKSVAVRAQTTVGLEAQAFEKRPEKQGELEVGLVWESLGPG
jgi:hypothetical protein